MVEINGQQYNLCFVDTCVISEAFEKNDVYRALILFLTKNKCFICLSINTFFEFENRPNYFQKLLKEVLEHILLLRENFPPKNSKSYSKEEAYEFVKRVIHQQLSKFNATFYESFKHSNEIDLNVFKSLRSQLYLTFWKFYKLKDRKPRLSDVYDLSMSSVYPYMDYILSENNIVTDIRQIKNIASIFKKVEPLSIKDILSNV